MTFPDHSPKKQQDGFVLAAALVILVIMTLGALALMRSVDTGNMVAGNMSFQQAATLAGEKSTEQALNNFLFTNAAGSTLFSNSNSADGGGSNGYIATRQDPTDGNWDTYWNSTLKQRAVTLTDAGTGTTTDASGNTIRYVVHRLCDAAGAPFVVNCEKPPNGSSGSNSTGQLSPITSDQVYYRITTRIEGPRNTVAYTQTIVAM